MELTKALLGFVSSLVWPAVAVFALLLFRDPLTVSLERLQSAELPGGVVLSFSEQLLEAQSLAIDIEQNPSPDRPPDQPRVPLSKVNQRLIDLGLRPSPSGLQFQYYQPPNVNDPVLALAGLRTEVDAMIRNLADSFGVDVSVGKTVHEQLSALHKGGAILDRQLRLATKVIELCDAAIRGVPVTRVEAEAVVELAKVLAAEYVEWLGWGFPDRPWVDDPASEQG